MIDDGGIDETKKLFVSQAARQTPQYEYGQP
jgi:hypothetical protein